MATTTTPYISPFTVLVVKDKPKQVREALCAAQTALSELWPNDEAKHWTSSLQQLIEECDRHRPLGSDGQHNAHTSTCGCEV